MKVLTTIDLDDHYNSSNYNSSTYAPVVEPPRVPTSDDNLKDIWTEVGETIAGYKILRTPNGVGGYLYKETEFDAVWDTTLLPKYVMRQLVEIDDTLS
jgi:hypothetical protein